MTEAWVPRLPPGKEEEGEGWQGGGHVAVILGLVVSVAEQIGRPSGGPGE